MTTIQKCDYCKDKCKEICISLVDENEENCVEFDFCSKCCFDEWWDNRKFVKEISTVDNEKDVDNFFQPYDDEDEQEMDIDDLFGEPSEEADEDVDEDQPEYCMEDLEKYSDSFLREILYWQRRKIKSLESEKHD